MDLSIIIVNYNVRFFLSRLLQSIRDSIKNLDYEIIIVDNASIDGSVDYLREHFKGVNVIANAKNVGFSKANNQGLQQAKGKHVLYLNPDTLVSTNAIESSFNILEKDAHVGAVTVKLLDGLGHYLPESKRNLPNLGSSIAKMAGFPINPKKRQLNYYARHINENENGEIDVLCGAYMMVRGELVREIGGFNESYFMYGEDIDLSYAIQQKGFTNYYLGEESIIHYKGESTDSWSWKRITNFYDAMYIFYKRHYDDLWSPIVWFSSKIFALLHYVKGVVGKYASSIIIFLLSAVLIYGAKYFWANFYFNDSHYYPKEFLYINLPLYACAFVFGRSIMQYVLNAKNLATNILGVFASVSLILIIYALLPLEYRFSRAIILLSGLSLIACYFIWNLLFETNNKWVVIALSLGEDQLMSLKKSHDVLTLAYDKNDSEDNLFRKIQWLVHNYEAKHIFINQEFLPLSLITRITSRFAGVLRVSMISAQENALFLAGGQNVKGKMIPIRPAYSIGLRASRITKRLTDIALLIFSVILIVPCIILLSRGIGFVSFYHVLMGKKTWVGYSASIAEQEDFPNIKSPTIDLARLTKDDRNVYIYAESYSLLFDISYFLQFIWTGYKK